ncbi:MAG: hypothetical protein AB9922_07435 [Bacteroidales bacterium]
MNIQDILTYVLPLVSAAISWVVSRFVEKRKRNNDFIAELQTTINNIGENYTNTLNKFVDLQKQNATLLQSQHKLELRVKELLADNDKLRNELKSIKESLSSIQNTK